MKSKFLLIIFLFVLIPSILLLVHFSFQDETEPVNVKNIPDNKRCEVDSDCVLGAAIHRCCGPPSCGANAVNTASIEIMHDWIEENCDYTKIICPLYARCLDDTEYEAKCINDMCVAQEVPSWNIFRKLK